MFRFVKETIIHYDGAIDASIRPKSAISEIVPLTAAQELE
jgi:hypothetical protein